LPEANKGIALKAEVIEIGLEKRSACVFEVR
jgi:hypothetical protein